LPENEENQVKAQQKMASEKQAMTGLLLFRTDSSSMKTTNQLNGWRRARTRRSHGGGALWTAFILMSCALSSLASPPWSPPVKLSRPTSNAESPSVAINDNGAMVAVWSQQDGVSYNVQAALNLSGGWTNGVNISAAGPSGMRPDVAVDNAGVAIAIWTDGTAIQAAKLLPSGNWSQPLLVSAVGNLATAPQIVVDGSGNATAMWVRTDISGITGLETADRPAGGSWSNPTVLATGTFSGFNLVANAAGDTAAIWNLGLFTANTVIYASDRPVGGVWSGSAVVAPGALSQGGAQIGIAANGDLTACWRTNIEIRVVDKPAGGNWSSSVTLCKNSAITGFPMLAKTSSGDDMVALLSLSGFNNQIRTSVRPTGSGWTPVELISSSSVSALDLHAGTTAGGSFVLSWADDNAFKFESTTRTATTPWTPRTLIGSGMLLDDFPTDLAVAGNTALGIWFGVPIQAKVASSPVSP
jgi:hypothetical protein